MVMSLFMGQLSFGQTGTIQIGSGTSTNTQMPIYSCYGYNYTQQIVTSAEYLAGGGIAGDITKLRFYYNASGTTIANWNNWTVYMGHTSKTSFTSTTDWVPSASMTQVFTGTIAPVAGNWFEMTLSSPFTYDGTSNIVVAVDENASSYSCTASFRSYSSATNTAIYYYSDGTNPNPASPPTASGRTGTLAQIQFFGAVASCFTPTGITASSVTNTSASLSWTAPSSGTAPSGYEYEVRTSGAAGSGSTGLVASGSPTTNSASVSALTSNTSYSVYVRSFCGGSDYSAWTSAATFKTLCDAISTLPFTENFDTVTAPALPSCWTKNDVNADGDSWITYTGYSNSGTTSAGLYTDGNSGSNNDYLILPTITLTGNQRLVYYVRARSASEPNDYTVKLSTTDTAPASFTNTLLPLTSVSSVTYTKVQIDLSAYSGNVNIAFHVPSGGLDGWYLYIDDVTVENNPSCFETTGLAVSSVTNNSASLAWSGPTSGTTPIGYEYEVRTSGAAGSGATGLAFSGNPTTNSASLTGLSANTPYAVYVRTQCGASEFSVWTLATNFTTLCDPISALPWSEGFEGLTSVSTTTFPSCWKEGTGTNWASLQTSTSSYNDPRSGTKYIGCNYSGTNDRIWTPGFQMVSGKSYEFTTYFVGDGYASWVGDVVTNTTTSASGETVLGSSFITSATTSLSGTNYTKVTRVFIPSVSGVYYFGVRVSSSFAPYSYLGFDDFSVAEMPDCTGAPSNGVAVIPSTSGCNGAALTLSATGLTTGSGISYQWQSSPDDTNWTDISGANAATYNLTTGTGLTYYRVNTTCTPSSTTSNSSSVSYTGTICTYNTSYSTGVAYSSIMSTGTTYSGWQGTSGDDNVTTTQALTGTTFKFQGQTVTGFQASTNGWMTFNTSNTLSSYTNALGGSTPTKVLAPFWDDMVLTGNDYANRNACMRYQVTGTLGSGSAVITVEWAGMEKFSAAGPNINFQVKLHESDNHIEYVYGNFEAFDGTLGATTSSPNSLYSYSIGYNGANPSGTGASDRFALQTPNANHFSATSDPANHNIMPVCFSQFTLTPGTYSGLTSAPVAVVPSNDDAVGAISITATSAPVTSYCGTYFTSKNATDSGAGLPTCTTVAATAGSQDDDVWFKFTTSSISDYTIKVRPSGYYDAVVQLLDTSFTPISCSNSATGGFTETVNATGLTTGGAIYYVRVFHNGANVGTSSGEFSIAVNEVINPPTNDNIAGATLLSSSSLTCSATSSEYPATLSATASVTTPTVTCGTADDDVWYYFVASSASQIVSVQSGTGYNAAFTVYSSSDNTDLASASAGTLTVAGSCQNNTSTAGLESYSAATFVPGNYYFVRVYHAATGTGSGNFTICVTSVLAPNCTTLTTPVDGTTGVAIGTVALAWTAPSADATHSAPTSYDVYRGTTSGALALFTNTTNTTVNLTGVTYGTYYVRIVPKNAGGSAVGGCTETSFTTIPDPCAGNLPAGDTFATAIDLGTLTNSGATASGDNNTSNCWHNDYTTTSTPGASDAYDTNDVFYKFVVADTCNSIDIDICTTSFDTFIHLLDSTGTKINEFDQGCDSSDGTYETGLTLTPGTYYFVLESWDTSETGTYTLNVSYTGSAPQTYYVDGDSDNYGDSALPTVTACTKPTGYALLNGDCNDNNPAINPGHVEVLYNGIDDNCDGQLDEGFEKTTVLNSSSCSANLAFIYNSINAEIKSGVTGYRFEVTNLTNPLAPVQTIDRTVQWFTLTQLASYDYSTTYSIKVMLRVGTTWLGYYGDACTVSTPDVSSPTGGSAVVVSPVCGTKLPTVSSHNIYTNLISGVTGYKYRVTRGTEVQELVKTTHWFRLNQLPNYVYGATYTVEVAFKTTGGYTPYGPACTILSPDVPSITSCGQTVNVPSNVYTTVLSGVTQYTFEVTNLTNTSEAVQVINRPNHYLPVSLITGYSSANMYSIRVAVTSTGIQSDYGTACEINVPAPTRSSNGNLTSEFKAVGFPNPFTNNFTLDITTTSEEKVSVMVYDMIGKLLDRVEVNATDNALELGANYPAGVYNVIVSQGEKVESVRMVKR